MERKQLNLYCWNVWQRWLCNERFVEVVHLAHKSVVHLAQEAEGKNVETHHAFRCWGEIEPLTWAPRVVKSEVEMSATAHEESYFQDIAKMSYIVDWKINII